PARPRHRARCDRAAPRVDLARRWDERRTAPTMVTRADTGDTTPAGTSRRWGRDRVPAAGDADGPDAPGGEAAGGVAAEVVGVVRATLDTIARAGTVSAAGLG